jgi:catechol O-methyltransferase
MSKFLPPGGKIFTVEMSEHNFVVAKAMIEYAGMSDRIEVIHGTLADAGGKTLQYLKSQVPTTGFDFVFVDHWKEAYLSDLIRLLDARLLQPNAVVVADNVITPGAPVYRAWMQEVEGKLFTSKEHWSLLEYQSFIKDMVLVSTFTGRYEDVDRFRPQKKNKQPASSSKL